MALSFDVSYYKTFRCANIVELKFLFSILIQLTLINLSTAKIGTNLITNTKVRIKILTAHLINDFLLCSRLKSKNITKR